MFKHLFSCVSRLSNENFEEKVVKSGQKETIKSVLLSVVCTFIPKLPIETKRDSI